jgi:hypothetical protein
MQKSQKVLLTVCIALALIVLTWTVTAAASYDEPASGDATIEMQGVIEEVGTDDLVVAGLTVTVSDTTEIKEGAEPLALADLEVDWTVQIKGYPLIDGTILAAEIQVVSREPLTDETPIELSGVIETVGTDSLLVAGLTVTVDEATEIKDGDESLELADLETGWAVKVEGFILADGTIVAAEIQVVSHEPATPPPSPSITSTVTLTPTLTPTPTATVTPTVTPVPEELHPVGLAVANFFDVPYDEIMAWHEQGIGFGNIAMAYFLADALADEGLTVEQILDEKLSGAGWGQVMKALGLNPGRKDKNLGQVMSERDDSDEPEGASTETDDHTDEENSSPGKGKGKEKDQVPPGQAKKDRDKGKGKGGGKP